MRANPDVISVLQDGGANVLATDKSGKRAIDYAREDEELLRTDVFWRLNDASFE